MVAMTMKVSTKGQVILPKGSGKADDGVRGPP